VTALSNNGTGRISRYVVVKGQGTGFCDLRANFVEDHYSSELKEMYVSLGEPAQSLEYIKTQETEQRKIVNYFVGSIFMSEDTRHSFHVGVNKAYPFELEEARLLGNLLYFARHPDRYPKSLASDTPLRTGSRLFSQCLTPEAFRQLRPDATFTWRKFRG